MRTYRVTFEDSDRVERIRASDYRNRPPWIEFVVAEGDGLNVEYTVIARIDGATIARITTTG